MANKKSNRSKANNKIAKPAQSAHKTERSEQTHHQSGLQSQKEGPKNSQKNSQKEGHWQSYGLDQIAQVLVLNALEANKDSLNESHKMRMAAAYGLERFWGEHLRLMNSKKDAENVKSRYWKAVWDELVKVMSKGGVSIPNQTVAIGDTKAIREMSEKLWQLDIEAQRIALSVLTQLCDCLVWWTQRYKGVR